VAAIEAHTIASGYVGLQRLRRGWWCLAGHDRNLWLELVGVCSPESRVRVELPVVPAGCFPVLGGEC